MSLVELGMLIDIGMWFLLPDNQKIVDKGWFCRSKYKYIRYGILWLSQNIITENTKTAQIQYLWEKLIEDT